MVTCGEVIPFERKRAWLGILDWVGRKCSKERHGCLRGQPFMQRLKQSTNTEMIILDSNKFSRE